MRRLLAGMADELAKVDIDITAGEGPAAGYVDVMIPRLRSTFEVIAHLLVDGRSVYQRPPVDSQPSWPSHMTNAKDPGTGSVTSDFQSL